MTAQPRTTAPAPATRAENLALLAVVVLLLGTAWPAMKIGLAGATPIQFAAARAILGAAVSFLLLTCIRQLRLPSRADLPIIVSVGLFQMTFFFALANLGLPYLPAVRSAVLAYTTALWLVPLALLVGGAVPPQRRPRVAPRPPRILLLPHPPAEHWAARR